MVYNGINMKENISYLNWKKELNSKNSILSIGDDVVLLDSLLVATPNHPFKVDTTTVIIGLNGYSTGTCNLEKRTTRANSFTIILPGQILTHEYSSDDFEAKYIAMSNRFISMLGMHENFPTFNSVSNNSSITLSDKEFRSVLTFYEMLKYAVCNTDNEYRLETAKHLTLAFFYGSSSMFANRNMNISSNKDRQDFLVDRFIELVKSTYKTQRSMTYYADKLCITPKYLSTVIKLKTGTTGNDWIDKYVILEAKALLKSTNMTISQISDELGFPSQSFFGKYFKRIEGISPREYKGK